MNSSHLDPPGASRPSQLPAIPSPSRTTTTPAEDDEARRRFEELYRAHYRKIVAYARRRTQSVGDADDVAASTFAVAWRRLDTFLSADEPLAWLYGVAYRTVLSQRRQIDRSALLAEKFAREQPGSVEGVESVVEISDQVRRAREAVETLPQGDQEILRLVGWEECSHAEIAEVLGISRVLVRTRLLRARRRLRSAYSQLQEAGESKGGQP